MARLLYGTGMRLIECLRLWVKDVDFDLGEILIRDGKGAKDRVTVLPRSLVPALRAHLHRVRGLRQGDREAGRGGVQLPDAMVRKYPNAPREGGWFWVFPARVMNRGGRGVISPADMLTGAPRGTPVFGAAQAPV
jgi:integrase